MLNAAGQVVLCTGQGVQTVTLDHRGDPIEVVHICPDCVMAAVAVLPQDPQDPIVVSALRTVVYAAERTNKISVRYQGAKARGPPVGV